MSFSKEWDEAFKSDTHLSIYPWTDLVSYVMRYAKPLLNNNCNVLELGCGAGANIEFLNSLGVNYHAIEGSIDIVDKLKIKFPLLSDKIINDDFTKSIPFNTMFDIVVDRAALTHNTTVSIQQALSLISKRMHKGSIYIGIDWFSCNHSDYLSSNDVVDSFTRNNFQKGSFRNLGNCHFSTKNHLIELFDKFHITVLEEKIIKNLIDEKNTFASFNFIATKL
jgi:SAM-dependent methyltransferase